MGLRCINLIFLAAVLVITFNESIGIRKNRQLSWGNLVYAFAPHLDPCKYVNMTLPNGTVVEDPVPKCSRDPSFMMREVPLFVPGK
ncbi:hypothetical protein TKK_0010706 [Trichogramma kaykai]